MGTTAPAPVQLTRNVAPGTRGARASRSELSGVPCSIRSNTVTT